jgi:hypothetical protein
LKADLLFLRDQKRKRVMTLGCRCKIAEKYSKKLKKRNERRETYEIYREKQSYCVENQAYLSTESSNCESDSQSDIESESFCEPKNAVVLDKNIAKNVVLTGVTRGFSNRDMVHFMTDVIVQSGGDVQDFNLSEKSLRRAKSKTINKEVAQGKSEKCS